MTARKHRSGTVDATIIVNRGDDDEEITVEVSGYFEPEQNGGWDDPSWPASVELESAEVDGQAFVLTESEKFSAIEALWSVVHGD
jgi:hypothetical protein